MNAQAGDLLECREEGARRCAGKWKWRAAANLKSKNDQFQVDGKKKQRVNAHTSGTAASVSLIRQIVGTGYLNTGVLRMPYQETRQIMQIDEESLMFRRIR
jgi:hypothetical protein